MQVLYERCAAVDVGKDVIAVAARLPGEGRRDGRQTIRRTFRTFYGVLGEAARWLSSAGVTHVAMEATGIYSMPVYHALIEHGDFTQVLVCNAGHVKNVPGRKTDMADAEWLAHLLECGLLKASFIPPADIKAARDVLRYRAKVVQSRTSEVQRLGNVLQDAGIKIDSVPGRLNETWFKATKEGMYYGQCSELCGKDHAFMPIAVRVVNDAEFASWVEGAKKKYAANPSNSLASAGTAAQ